MKKRILSILLTLCMVMCAISPVMSYADPGVSASGSGAYGALLTPDTTPPVGWAEDERTHTVQRRGNPLPSPRGMSRSFTATAMQRGNRHRITPRCMTS